MLGEKHDLVHELPEYKERIHALKVNNHHFAKLFNEYHDLDHLIRRCETEVEVHSDEYVHNLKKNRLAIKDDLLKIILAQ